MCVCVVFPLGVDMAAIQTTAEDGYSRHGRHSRGRHLCPCHRHRHYGHGHRNCHIVDEGSSYVASEASHMTMLLLILLLLVLVHY